MSRLATATAVLLAAACSQPVAKSGRYRMASDPGSRHGFEYVQDRETGRWVIRDCELRVAEARALPEPLQDEEHGSKLDVSIFRPGSVESGLLLSIDFERRDGFRVWRGAEVLGEDDLEGRVAYGIQLECATERDEPAAAQAGDDAGAPAHHDRRLRLQRQRRASRR